MTDAEAMKIAKELLIGIHIKHGLTLVPTDNSLEEVVRSLDVNIFHLKEQIVNSKKEVLEIVKKKLIPPIYKEIEDESIMNYPSI